MNQEKLYFNEWFEEYCKENFPNKNIRFNDFLNNMRPENQKWRNSPMIRNFYFPIYNKNNEVKYYFYINQSKYKIEISVYDFINKAFNYNSNILGISASRLRNISAAWKSKIRNYSYENIYFSSYPISDYSINLYDKNIVQFKKRALE